MKQYVLTLLFIFKMLWGFQVLLLFCFISCWRVTVGQIHEKGDDEEAYAPLTQSISHRKLSSSKAEHDQQLHRKHLRSHSVGNFLEELCNISTVRDTLLAACTPEDIKAFNLSNWISTQHPHISTRKNPYNGNLQLLGTNLLDRLDCGKLASKTKQKPALINFLATSTSPPYEIYLAFYVFFALRNNPSSVAEVVVENRTAYVHKFGHELDVLTRHFETSDSAFCVREFSSLAKDFQNLYPAYWSNSARFFELPMLDASYTYVGDTDIMIEEEVLEKHYVLRRTNGTSTYIVNHDSVMQHNNIPYSNVVRSNFNALRLTGVYIARTKDFYSPRFVETLTKYATKITAFHALIELAETEVGKWGMDEVLLYHICNETHGVLPKANHEDAYTNFRPLHGMHLSTHLSLKNNKLINAKNWCNLIRAITPSSFNAVIHSFPTSCQFFSRFWKLTVGNHEALGGNS